MRPLLALVTTWPQVLVVRMGDRVGKGIRGAPRDALLAASVEPSERGFAFGFNRAADHFGAILGPIVAYLLMSYFAADPMNPSAVEFQSVFWFASLPVVFGLFVVFFFVRDDTATVVANGSQVRLSLRGFDPNFKRFLFIIAVFTLSNSTDAFLLLRAEQAGISPAVLPLVWMTLHFSKVGFSLIGGELSDRIGRKKLIFAGWLVYALVYLGFCKFLVFLV